MKETFELVLPDNIFYTEDHEWARPGETVRVGISDYAQDQLGDITFVELPEIEDSFEQGEEFGTLESTKAVSELYMPVGGEVVAVNRELEESPGLINSEPYGDGWLIEIKPGDPSEMNTLMERDAYLDFLEELE